MGRPPPIGRGRLTRPRADGAQAGRGARRPRPRGGRGGGPRRGQVTRGSAARLISRAAHGPPRALLRAVRAATLFRRLLRDSPPRRARGRAPLRQVRGARRRPRGRRLGSGRLSPPQPPPLPQSRDGGCTPDPGWAEPRVPSVPEDPSNLPWLRVQQTDGVWETFGPDGRALRGACRGAVRAEPSGLCSPWGSLARGCP